jgi:multidrug efflux pump subunit AcrB
VSGGTDPGAGAGRDAGPPGRGGGLGALSVRQPVFAIVLSVLILIVGGLAYLALPVAEYPDIAPPTVVVQTQYPGASAETVAETVAAPIEQEINGVENMLYMYSQSTADGRLRLEVTFRLGTDPDVAQVLVQNRVAIATPRLPEETRRFGVTVRKDSPNLMMVVFMTSPDETYDQLYISNYALRRVRDVLLRQDGVGSIEMFGARDYSMRLWLDPDRMAEWGLTAGDVVGAVRAQNVQIAGGQLGEPPIADQAFQPNLTFQGRLTEPEAFGQIIVRATPDGRVLRLRDVARAELGAQSYATTASCTAARRWRWRSTSGRAPTRSPRPPGPGASWRRSPRTSRPASPTTSPTTRPASSRRASTGCSGPSERRCCWWSSSSSSSCSAGGRR